MTLNARQKGSRGEREALEWLTGFMVPVCAHIGVPVPVLSRNLLQTREGGYDVKGLDWLAIEVKRVETEFQSKWWDQVRKSKEETQIPCLLFRKNRNPWRAMVEIPTVVGGSLLNVTATLDAQQFGHWFQWQVYHRMRQKTS